MEIHRFYCPDIASPVGGTFAKATILSPDEAQHAVRVLRLKEGDTLQLVNGQGWVFDGVLIRPHPKECLVSITSAIAGQDKRLDIHIAIAPPKNIARLEWFLEKATEIGIGRITPMLCEHSERGRLNHERLQRILVSALKQSKRTWIPELAQQMTFADVIRLPYSGTRFIAWLGRGSKALSRVAEAGKPSTVLIGPEGDFSEAEIEQAIDAGFAPVSLGSSRLRTETAALYACTALNILNE